MKRTLNRFGKYLASCSLCVLLAGCDYSVPLVETPTAPIDVAVLGTWEQTLDSGKVQRLLVLPMNAFEYLVVFPAKSDNALFARACLWEGPSGTLAQLDWFGTEDGAVPDDEVTFQFATYSLDNDRLTIRLLNPNTVSKSSAPSNELKSAIAANRSHPKLFRKAMVFHRADD